jgi:hypothetical protein
MTNDVMEQVQGAAMIAALQQQLRRLSALAVLQGRLRSAEPAELGFIAVNETHQVLPFLQAALWLDRDRRVHAVSGATAPEPGAPYVHWLEAICAVLYDADRKLGPIGLADLPVRLSADWTEFLPASLLWCPLRDRYGDTLGALLLARVEPWTQGDLALADAVAGGVTQALLLARLPRGRRRRAIGWRRPLAAAAIVALLAAALVPVPETVLAPAEVVPQAPILVRAPFAGVVETIAVQPNAMVRAGQVLLTLDRRQIATAHDIAVKALNSTRTEYRQVAQEAVSDPRVRGRVALLQSKIDEQQADADYQATLLERTTLVAPIDGVAVFNDPVEWLGKPVETGERIMMVAAPVSATVEAQVPAASILALEPGGRVLFFDNLQPDRPRSGRIEHVAYASVVTPDSVLAYAVRLRLPEGETVRLGMRGTAKLYGQSRPLLLWALRRPIATVRQWTGL